MRAHGIPHSRQVVFAVQHAGMDKLVFLLMGVWTGKAAEFEGHQGMRNGCGERETIEVATRELTLHFVSPASSGRRCTVRCLSASLSRSGWTSSTQSVLCLWASAAGMAGFRLRRFSLPDYVSPGL